MKELKIRNVVLFVLTFIGISGIVLGLDLTFNKPTTLNKIIASKIYKEPANKAFTDQNFYNCVVDAYNKTNSTSVAYTENLTDEQLQTITSLNCSGYGKEANEKIQNTSGLEKLINLTYLYVEHNRLTELDVSNNPKLDTLWVDNNQLALLDVSNNPELTYLYVEHNRLTELDVSNNPELIDLRASNNQLALLDVSNNPELTYLYVSSNQLAQLDVSNNPELIDLRASNNQLALLDVSNNPELTILRVYNNQLTELDVSNNPELIVLSAYDNQLIELDVSTNPELTGLSVDNNQLTEVDVSNNPKLTTLYVYDNQLTNLDVSNNPELIDLRASNNQLTALDVSTNPELTSLSVDNNQLTELDVSTNPKLTTLYVYDNQLTNLDVSNNPELIDLRASNNQLTALDLSNNTKLTTLYVGYNDLTNLDVSTNPELTTLYVDNNQLTELDVSNNTNLTYLYVNNNPFSIDFCIYKGGTKSIDESIKLPLTLFEGKTSTLQRLTNNNQEVIITDNNITINEAGEYEIKAQYEHNISSYNNFYTVTYNINVIEAISEKYNIGQDYIYVGTETNNQTILDNIEIKGYIEGITTTIEDNKLIIKYNEEILKELEIVKISSEEYDIGEDYIYVGTNTFDIEKITVTNGEKIIEDNALIIKYQEEILQEYPIISISSEEYDLSKDYIYVGTNTFDIENITVTNGDKIVEDNTLTIKYQENVLYTYEIIGIDFGELEVNNKMILMLEDITYEDFISNITPTGVTYKILSGEEEVTSGTLTKGMTLKVYKDNEEIDSYEITDEYLDLSLLEVDEEKKLIKELVLGTSISELKEKILTSGEVTIKDKDGKDLSDSDIVRSGAVVTIELSKETYEYTLSVKGDTTGDGVSSVADVGKLYQYLKGKITMEDCYIEAGNVAGEEIEIKVSDVGKLYQYIKGKISSLEE